ncbi:hypothetical protein BKA93DRAFT_771218 [Sparassis latifolia]
MHIILTGATGTVGAAALRQCLVSPTVTQLSILSRRQFPLPSGNDLDVNKAQIIVHEDYAAYPDELLAKLKGAEGCIWAQGVSQNDVNKDEYIHITYDFPLAAAKSFASLSPTDKFNFVYVSGEGADPTEKTLTFYGKIKGRAELALLALPSTPAYSALRIFNVRPGYVDPPNPNRPTSALRNCVVDSVIVSTLRTLLPGLVTPVGTLGRVLVDLATGDGAALTAASGIEAGGRTVRSAAIRTLGGL